MNSLQKLYRKDRHITRLLIMMVLWLAFMALTKFDKFYAIANFQTIAGKFPEFGLMSLGAMLCMITGGIDLSSVGIANMTSILMALYMRSRAAGGASVSGLMIVEVLLFAACIGFTAGALNGFLISKIHIPPILATLGVNQLLTGIALVVTNGKAVSDIPTAFSSTINQKLLKVVPGKRGTMTGLIPVRLLIMTYALSGMLAALGGMIMLANYNSARSDYGSVYTLQCILIVVLGGVSPTGGKGKISGVVLSIILLSLLEAGINRFPQISSYYITLIWGAVLLLVMVLNYFVEHPIARKKL